MQTHTHTHADTHTRIQTCGPGPSTPLKVRHTRMVVSLDPVTILPPCRLSPRHVTRSTAGYLQRLGIPLPDSQTQRLSTPVPTGARTAPPPHLLTQGMGGSACGWPKKAASLKRLLADTPTPINSIVGFPSNSHKTVGECDPRFRVFRFLRRIYWCEKSSNEYHDQLFDRISGFLSSYTQGNQQRNAKKSLKPMFLS